MQEHQQIIEDYFTILDTKKITEKERYDFFGDIVLLYEDWFKIKGQDVISVRHCKDKLIPIMEKTIKKTKDEYLQLFYKQYMLVYAFCGRRDLECFIDYMESERPYRVLNSRRDVLMPLVDSLNRLTFDPSLKMVVASYPPSLGKCVDENTTITTPYGYKKIKDINIGDEVCSMLNGEITNRVVTNKWNSKKTQVKITTQSGKQIVTSPEHHMLTLNGYKKSSDLTANDYFYSNLHSKNIFELLKDLKPTGERHGYAEELKYERKRDATTVVFARFLKHYPELSEHIYKDFFWEKITKIEFIDEEINMVDIEVEGTHNFIANGFVSHNSFTLNYYTAFLMGLSKNNSVLRMSYSDELVNGCSRSIKDLISSPLFTNVFTDFGIYNGKPFSKDKENEWQIKGSDVMTNHYARPRGGQITGVRANKAIILDDMTKGAEEATNSQIHKDLYTKWTTEILNRDDRDSTKFVLAGTMWSPEDLLNKVREDEERYSELKNSKKYKYTWETENAIFIRVPALDDNDESTCPSVKSTEYYRRLRDKLDPYFFACVYQQEPIAPTGLEFNYDVINTYDKLPRNEKNEPLYTNYCMASLDPARKGKDFVSMPIFVQNSTDHYMIDVLYQQKPMTELYDEIVDRIIQHKIIKLTLENNIDVSLKELLLKKLKDKGYVSIEIIEKYSTGKKEDRIKNTRGIIKRQMWFKSKNIVNRNTEYGKFMEDFTNYSFDFANKHDDAPDSLALYTSDIILGRGVLANAEGIDRNILGF